MPPSQQHAEILAPAGGEAQLRAAVTCGADAVYLGLRGFNARAGAENFAESTLAQTVGWCHARGVRVYVTLNTLITDYMKLKIYQTTGKDNATLVVNATIKEPIVLEKLIQFWIQQENLEEVTVMIKRGDKDA